jgi:hypothetical protein
MPIRIINIFLISQKILITPMFLFTINLFTSIFPEIWKKLCLVPNKLEL